MRPDPEKPDALAPGASVPAPARRHVIGRRFHRGAARRVAFHGALCAAASVLGGCASASLNPIQSTGLWWFASLALGGLAIAGFALGRLVERRRSEAEIHAARSQHAALRCAITDTVWRTDARHSLLADPADVPGASPAGTDGPTWFADPLLQQALVAQRPFSLRLNAASGAKSQPPADTPLITPEAHTQPGSPADSPLTGAGVPWLLQGHPVLDRRGRFAGFVGTARELPAVALNEAAAAAASAPAQSTGLPMVALGGPAVVAPQAEPAHADRMALAAETALAAARAESAEADNFSSTVAHDLRAPVRVVDGFTRIVKEDYGHLLDRVGNDHLDRVLNAAARMNQMIDALLTLTGLSSQPLTRQPVNLSQMAHYVVEELQRSHPGRDVDVNIEDGLQVVGDPTLLRLVLENLLGNAWKYSARNPKAQISLASVRHGSGRAFVVRDNGAGFDMRAAERLFGVFQRLHGASEFAGHGVGLASARRIVRRHGGDIWAEAEPARGAAFSFTLADS